MLIKILVGYLLIGSLFALWASMRVERGRRLYGPEYFRHPIGTALRTGLFWPFFLYVLYVVKSTDGRAALKEIRERVIREQAEAEARRKGDLVLHERERVWDE